jgi:hypothetical protein
MPCFLCVFNGLAKLRKKAYASRTRPIIVGDLVGKLEVLDVE